MVQANLLDVVEHELSAFSMTLKKSPNFSAFVANPTIPRGEKTRKVNFIEFLRRVINYYNVF